MKVVSLLPSATEIICLVGGTDMLVGRSHECDYPPNIRDRAILTGAKNKFESCQQMNDAVDATLSTGEGLYYIKENLIKQLQPDVIITQSLCNVCSVDLRLVQQLVSDMAKHNSNNGSSMNCSSNGVHAGSPNQVKNDTASAAAPGASIIINDPDLNTPKIISLNPFTLEEVLQDALLVGDALGLQQQAQEAVAGLQRRINAAQAFLAQQPPLQHRTVAFLEWFEPIFPGGHWTPQLIHLAGGLHPLNPPRNGKGAQASRAVFNDALVQLNPDWIIICPCGLDIQETLQQLPPVTASGWWPGLTAVQEGRVALVDGNQMFNRPGPRLVDGLEFLVGLLHKRHDLIPQNFPWRFLQQDELADAEKIWLEQNPGWKTRIQKAPEGWVPPKDDNEDAGIYCSSKGCCVSPATAATAAPGGAARESC